LNIEHQARLKEEFASKDDVDSLYIQAATAKLNILTNHLV